MRKIQQIKKQVLTALMAGLMIAGTLMTVNSQSNNQRESAEGEGKLVNSDGSKSRFSFNAKRNPNGKITGQATLRNPSYKAGKGEDEVLKIDITCLKVVGRTAIFGGTTKRKSSQTETEAAYFAVEDGEDRDTDKIFRGFFYGDDPAKKGEAALCQTLEKETLVFEPIAEGDIKVKR